MNDNTEKLVLVLLVGSHQFEMHLFFPIKTIVNSKPHRLQTKKTNSDKYLGSMTTEKAKFLPGITSWITSIELTL